MKTVETVFHQLTDTKAIMQDMKEILRAIDPEFLQEEEKFLAVCGEMEDDLGNSMTPSVSDYLAAKEEVFALEIIYIAWQGFRLNWDIFHHPVNALMLKGDYEQLHRERYLHTLPMTAKARQTQNVFLEELKKLGEDKWAYEEGIIAFYSYLETIGYKIAHYFGFRLADRFLPYVLHGYTHDDANTLHYSEMLHRDLNIDLSKLE